MATKLGTLTLDLVARIGSFTQGMRQASATAEREMGRVQNSVVTVDGLIKKLAVTAGAVFSVGQIINAADEYTQMAAQISNATSSQLEYDKVQKHLLETANTTYRSLKEAQQVYLDIGGALKAYGVSTDKALRITDSLSFSFTHNATATDKAKSATDAYKKSVYEGSVSGDSWRAMLSAIPSIVDDMSASLGKSKDEILTLGNAGKFTSSQLNDSFDKSREKSEELANAMSNSLKDGVQVLSTAFTVLVGEANMTYGVTNKMAEVLGILAENLDSVAKVAGVGAVFMAGTYIPMVVKGTYATISDTVSKVANITASRAKAVADLDVAKSNLASTAAMVRAMGVTNAQTAAMMANARAAYQQVAAAKAVAFSGAGLSSVLLGPVGLGVALASVAAGYLLMKDGAYESTKSLRENNESVEDAIKKYNELDEVKRRAQLVSEKDHLQDLGKEYDDVTAKLITATYSFSRHNDMTSEQSKQVNTLIAEYKNNGSVDEFSAKINSLSFINQASKDKFNRLGGAVKSAGDEFKKQKSVVEQMAPALKAVGDQAVQTAAETAGLSEELKKLIDLSSTKTQENLIRSDLVGRGFKDGLIDLILEYRKKEDLLGKSGRLSEASIKAIGEQWKSEEALNKSKENRLKLEEKSKKLIDAQGAAMKVNALVAANAAKANYAALEAAKKLPKGLLSAVNMTESPNSNYAKSGAGAQGPFQFMPKTAAAYKVDVSSVESSSNGASEYLSKLLKMFEGNLENALRAYNWGEGNMQNYLKYGSGMKNGEKGYFPDKPMPKETREYSGKVLGYMGGASGVSFTEDYSYDDYIKEQEQFAIEREKREKEIAQKQKEIQVEYYSDWQKLEADNQEKIKRIEENFVNDSTERDRLLDLQVKAYEVDVGNWFKAQDEKVAAEREANKQILAERYNLINASLAMSDQIKNLSSGAEGINARASMSPQAYAEWSLSNNRSNAQADLKNQRVGVEQDIMTSDLYSNDDDRYQALLDAHQEYRDGLAAIDVAYDQQVKDLAQSQSQNQMDIWQDLLTRTGTIFSSMAEMVKNTAGESSAAYKVMFLTNQGISMAQAMINTEVAATKAMAEGGYVMGIPMATAIRGLGYASVGMIAAQTISGMAHDGIDNIPKEGTWLLDKGERVVDSRTNGDLKDYLAKGGGGGDFNAPITVHVSVQSNGESSVDTQGQSKQLGQMIGNAVRTVIRQEQRQGGLLSK